MRPIWSFDYQKRADPTEITTFFGDFPDPAGSSVRRIGNALILGLEPIPVNEAAPDHASHIVSAWTPDLASVPEEAWQKAVKRFKIPIPRATIRSDVASSSHDRGTPTDS